MPERTVFLIGTARLGWADLRTVLGTIPDVRAEGTMSMPSLYD